MKKQGSKPKGKKYENILHKLLICLLKEWEFIPLELNPQGSGLQFGKDHISKWSAKIEGKEIEFAWAIESKSHGCEKHKEKQIPKNETHTKLTQFYNSSVQCDCWCIFAPFGYVDNEFREIVDNSLKKHSYPFRIVLWTVRQQIGELISCFPKIYKDVYGKTIELPTPERKRILDVWKDQVIKRGFEGKGEQKIFSAKTTPKAQKGIPTKRDIKRVKQLEQKKDVLSIYTPQNNQKPTSIALSGKGIERSVIDEEIKTAKDLLDRGSIGEAKTSLFRILGKIEDKPDFGNELARVYNNIGVACSIEDKLDDAIEYFRKAVRANTDFIIAVKNLAAVHINKSQKLSEQEAKSELDKALQILQPLMVVTGKGQDPAILQVYLKLVRAKEGVSGVIGFIEKSVQYLQLFTSDDVLSLTVGYFYLEAGQLDKALKFADISCKLKRDVESLLFRGRVMLAIALEKDAVPYSIGYSDIAPEFQKKTHLDKAKSDFDEAMSVAREKELTLFYDEVFYFQNVVRTWLGEQKIKRMTLPISDIPHESTLGDKFLEAVEAFRKRDFEVSFSLLKSLPDFDSISYKETIRIARAFLYNGCPEIALELFQKIEDEATNKHDFQYWLDLSLVHVLLADKNKAILAASKARGFAEQLPKGPAMQMVLSHYGAVMLRYASEEGGDRMLEGALAFDEKFPELKSIQKIDYKKDKGKIIKMIQDRREWANKIKEIYVKQPIPSYFLQKTFKKPYIAIWSGRDPEMPFEYTLPSVEFRNELEANYSKDNVFVFDYLSLLTLSKLNLLNDIEKICPSMEISFSLFQKIQEELLQEENESLRRLWNFLRENPVVKIIKYIPKGKLKGQKIDDLFEEWLIDSMNLAKKRGTIMVTDDFRLYRFLKSEAIAPLNTWLIIQKIREQGLLDSTMYSKAIGKLAECFYTFVSFSGDDLYVIVAEDDFKLRARSFHLINQIFLPGSDLMSFSTVFLQFISKMWRPGLITEDKIFWTGYISNIFAELVSKAATARAPIQPILETAPYFGSLWAVAIKSATKEELIKLNRKLPEILAKPVFVKVKENATKQIGERLEELKKKK